MIKKLTRQGNSSALILDRPLMDLIGLNRDSEVRVTVQGGRLIIEPLTEQERQARFDQVLSQTSAKNAEVFRRLAK